MRNPESTANLKFDEPEDFKDFIASVQESVRVITGVKLTNKFLEETLNYYKKKYSGIGTIFAQLLTWYSDIIEHEESLSLEKPDFIEEIMSDTDLDAIKQQTLLFGWHVKGYVTKMTGETDTKEEAGNHMIFLYNILCENYGTDQLAEHGIRNKDNLGAQMIEVFNLIKAARKELVPEAE